MSNVQMESGEWAGLGMGCKGLSPGEWDGTWPANPEAGQEGRPHPFNSSTSYEFQKSSDSYNSSKIL